MSVITDTKKRAVESTWIDIDIKQLYANLQAVQDKAGFDAKVLAVVKANAYGHGLLGIAKALEGKVSYLGVSSVHEALELKAGKIKTPIFLFGQLLPEELEQIISEGFTLSVSSLDQAKKIAELSGQANVKTPIHIKVDTGMGRLGIPFRKAIKEIEEMAQLPGLFLEGIYTHLPTAEIEDGFCKRQLSDFSLLIRALEDKDIRFVFRHAANSSGCLRVRDSALNMIRPGLMMYGLYPDDCLKSKIKIQPVLSLKTKVIMVKRLMPGESVGYGREFIADKPTTIATVALGYSHGYPFRTSSKGFALLHGKAYPLAGRVSMDYLCLQLGDDFAEPGEAVTLIGKDHDEKISASDVAGWVETIPYEIVTGLSQNISRYYLE